MAKIGTAIIVLMTGNATGGVTNRLSTVAFLAICTVPLYGQGSTAKRCEVEGGGVDILREWN